MVTFGVPIREQGCTNKRGRFEDKERKKRSAVMRKTKRGDLPQGAKSLHLGALFFP
jgi:hypothetical protein